jgi:cytochrome c oxidase assembly protein subunit 15
MNPESQIASKDRINDRRIAIWLLICCVLVFAMVILGGVTRLTGSGLSMVEWDPIFGFIPPMDQAEWERVFTLYQASPEYQKINVGMDLAGFKKIYWFEFWHRVLGRAIGTVFLLPFLYFLARGMLRRSLIPKLVAMFVLGGLQGLLGWYMVKSGLVDDPHVSQYRLTAHLMLAMFIYAYMFWVALGLLLTDRQASDGTATSGVRLSAGLLGLLVLVTVMSGGFVAGLKAGFVYNTFPLMDGRWIPEAMFLQEPLWRNFFENVATVQFDHRVLAILTFLGIGAFWLTARPRIRTPQARAGMHLLLAAAVLQVALGISTLLLYVPVALAAIHQAGALLLFTAILFLNHRLIHE